MRYTRRPSSDFSLVIVRPCFFLRAPDIAPLTLCACQTNDLLICSMVAPLGRRSIASSWASLVFGLRLCCSLRTEPALAVSAVFAVALFLLVMGGSLRFPRASVPAAHAFASCAHDLKLKS